MTYHCVGDWVQLLRQISTDSDKNFSPLAQLVAVHKLDKFHGDQPRCEPTESERPFYKEYFFSAIFNDECPDLASLLANKATGYHWCAFFLGRTPWGTAVATIIDTLTDPGEMETKYNSMINGLYELGVPQVDLVGLPHGFTQTGNSCGLQAAAIVASVVQAATTDAGRVGPLTGALAAVAAKRLRQLVHANPRCDRAVARQQAAQVVDPAAILDAVPCGSAASAEGCVGKRHHLFPWEQIVMHAEGGHFFDFGTGCEMEDKDKEHAAAIALAEGQLGTYCMF